MHMRRIHPQIGVGVCPVGGGAVSLKAMFIDEVFTSSGGLATREQLLMVMSRKMLAAHLKAGAIIRVWHGIYSLTSARRRLVDSQGWI